MKVHIDADMISGVVHDFVTNSANVHDLNVVDELLHGKGKRVIASAEYSGVDKREELADKDIDWSISARPGFINHWRLMP